MPPTWDQTVFCPVEIGRLFKESPWYSVEGAWQKHIGPMHLKRIVNEAGKGITEVVRDLLVMIAAETLKRGICG